MTGLRPLACTLCVALLAGTALAQVGSMKRASVDSAGAQADLGSYYDSAISLSGDGLTIAFASNASNLVPDDTNAAQDIFLHDLVTGQTTRVSVSSSGAQGNFDSLHPSISTSGRYVSFASLANNLVPGDTNQAMDVFVRDVQLGQTIRVSVSSTGAQANSLCTHPSISADGQFVSFRSFADNLDPADKNGWDDIFLRDVQGGQTTLVSVGAGGVQGQTNCGTSSLSKDGRFVVFHSYATNLVAGNLDSHVYVKDLQTGLLELADVDSQGNPSAGPSGLDGFPSISDDGRYVSFRSRAPDLVPGDTNGFEDIFRRDRVGGTTTRVNVSTSGAQANQGSLRSSISENGRYVAFDSWASNLVGNDANGKTDVFVRDLLAGTTSLVSVAMGGGSGNEFGMTPTISPGGRFVAFNSLSSNLVPGDTNGAVDVYVRDRTGCTPTVASYCVASDTSIAGCQAQLSGSGVPSLASPSAFTLATGPIPGANVGIAYFGTGGPAATPFGTQGGRLCVAAPVLRSQSKPGGGTIGACNGQLSFTLQDLIAAAPAAVQAGASLNAAVWFRDPPSPDGFGLSDGLWFTVCP